MVARSYFLSLLALATAFGSAVAVAAPQDDETAPPLNELEAVPVDFDSPAADARPVPGAESNTLLEAAPELGSLADAVPNPEVTKRDLGGLLEKRAVCKPGVHIVTWKCFADKFCNHFFPNAKVAYYLREGRCVSGSVKVYGRWVKRKLNFKCCAKQCGAHVSFVGVTQGVCKASFRKAIHYGAKQCGKIVRSSDNARDHRDPLVCSFWAN
jgi:hypothetical protein